VDVLKFGGSSVQTAETMKAVAQTLAKHPYARVVVVSALGGVTMQLINLCMMPVHQRSSIIDTIVAAHDAMVKTLNISDEPVLHLANTLHLLPPKIFTMAEKDAILALGELCSSQVLCSFLKKEGFLVRWVDARQYIITNDAFGKAAPCAIETHRRMQVLHHTTDTNIMIITQGFIGATLDGVTTTLGRGGSDVSAAWFAEGFAAKKLYIYTDVPGVHSIDPRLSKHAKRVENLSFSEMSEMANFGAKIVHPATLAPCVRANIPVVIASTFSEGVTQVDDHTRVQRSILGVTLRPMQIIVTIKSVHMLNACGFLERVFHVLAQHHVGVDVITTSEVQVALTIDGTQLPDYPHHPFEEHTSMFQTLSHIADIHVETEWALVAMLGDRLRQPGFIQQVLTSVTSYPLRFVCYGANPSSIGFLVSTHDSPHFARQLHDTWLHTHRD
jgi:aspartate kinase